MVIVSRGDVLRAVWVGAVGAVLGNALLILVLIGFVDYLAGGQDPWPRRFCLAMACTVPFAAQGVMQFRLTSPPACSRRLASRSCCWTTLPSRRARRGWWRGWLWACAVREADRQSVHRWGRHWGRSGWSSFAAYLARGALPPMRRVAAGWGWFRADAGGSGAVLRGRLARRSRGPPAQRRSIRRRKPGRCPAASRFTGPTT